MLLKNRTEPEGLRAILHYLLSIPFRCCRKQVDMFYSCIKHIHLIPGTIESGTYIIGKQLLERL